MVKDTKKSKMEVYTKVITKETRNMGVEYKNMQMETHTMDSLSMDIVKAQEYSKQAKDITMLVNGNLIKCMAMVLHMKPMVINIKDYLFRVRNLVKVCSSSTMVIYIRDTFPKISLKDMVNYIGKMEIITKGSLKTVNLKDLVNLSAYIQKKRNMKDISNKI